MTIPVKWQPIEHLEPTVEERLKGDLAAVDALHRSWNEFTSSLDEADHHTLRRRTLRKHAIETGIIERLYDIDWGLTKTLVAEGLTGEAVARYGGEVSQGVLAMLQAQFQGLELVTDYVRQNWPLTTSFVKELHALITRAQYKYDATDPLGRPFRAELNHGSYKTMPNNVRRTDGSLLEFAPPEQVDGEIERLVELYNGMQDVHPIVSAAWLHHRFVQIHPFQDGNGRMARALTLISLGRAKYPPMVVDRRSRDRYLTVLDRANDGDLIPLGKLFAKLAKRSILRELEPVRKPVAQTAREVALDLARSLERKRQEEAERQESAVHIRARQLHSSIYSWFDETEKVLKEDMASEAGTVSTRTDQATPDDPPPTHGGQPPSEWWHYQIVESARRAQHFAVMDADRWWTMLEVKINGVGLRFLASIHHVGSRRSGVMAITSFGDIRVLHEGPTTYHDAFVATSWDAFTFSHYEEVENRTDELYEWLDQSLAVALQKLMRRTLGI